MDAVDDAIEKSGPTSLDKERAAMNIRSLELHLMRTVYQCSQCERLYINDNNNRLNEFTPNRLTHERSILATALGEKWRPLIGDWNDSRSGEFKGYIWYQDFRDHNMNYSSFHELEEEYHKQLSFLMDNNILQTAMLRRNNQIIHSWESESHKV